MTTSKAQHTPGPWFYSPDVDLERWLPCIGTAYDDGQGPIYTGEAIHVCAFDPEFVPTDADARLMAAAPDLLAACKAFINAAEREMLAGTLAEDQLNPLAIAYREARAAIAKAEGC